MPKKNHSPVNLEIRLRKKGAKRQPTRTEIRSVLMFVVDRGELPQGWEAAAVDWRHPNARGAVTWRHGSVKDLGAFAAVMVDQLDTMAIGIQRAGDVEPPSPWRWVTWFQLRAGERSEKYFPGQQVSRKYADRYGHKVQRRRRRVEADVPDHDWEVLATVDYE